MNYQNVHGGDIYKYSGKTDFSANINPLGIPKRVKEAMIDSIDGASAYPDPECTALKEALSEYYKIDRDYIVCGNGAADIIFMMSYALKPKKALILAPTFAEYENALRASGCQCEYYMLDEEDDFIIREDYIEYLRDDLDMVYICNPNNPTGMIAREGLLIDILKVCNEKGILLIIDECFMEFVDRQESYSMGKYIEEYKNLIILNAFTKIYAIPGVRLGYMRCSDVSLNRSIRAASQPWNVSVMAQAAGIAALLETDYVRESVKYIANQRKKLQKALYEKGYKVYDSKANYIFFRGDKELFEKFLYLDYIIRDCSNYIGLKEGYYRIAVRTEEENNNFIEMLKKI